MFGFQPVMMTVIEPVIMPMMPLHIALFMRDMLTEDLTTN
jgi:hypothetical protein